MKPHTMYALIVNIHRHILIWVPGRRGVRLNVKVNEEPPRSVR